MINSKQLLHEFVSKLTVSADRDELHAIVYKIFEKEFSLTKTEVVAEKQIEVSGEILARLDGFAQRINCHEPLQYILGEAWFYGRKFFVDKSVLIPRPETEELVRLIIDLCEDQKLYSPEILDVGTGSGCIPITLALEIPKSKISALDKSREALIVAQKNSVSLKANVNFFNHDFLSDQLSLSGLDCIVSNPPYIPIEEHDLMASNVKDFEPHMALFVENNDPFIFYTAIAKAGMKTLKPEGFVAVEINERFGSRTKEVFDHNGYAKSTLIRDISGKDRFVIAWKN